LGREGKRVVLEFCFDSRLYYGDWINLGRGRKGRGCRNFVLRADFVRGLFKVWEGNCVLTSEYFRGLYKV